MNFQSQICYETRANSSNDSDSRISAIDLISHESPVLLLVGPEGSYLTGNAHNSVFFNTRPFNLDIVHSCYMNKSLSVVGIFIN